jgi:hypothetical protein
LVIANPVAAPPEIKSLFASFSSEKEDYLLFLKKLLSPLHCRRCADFCAPPRAVGLIALPE